MGNFHPTVLILWLYTDQLFCSVCAGSERSCRRRQRAAVSLFPRAGLYLKPFTKLCTRSVSDTAQDWRQRLVSGAYTVASVENFAFFKTWALYFNYRGINIAVCIGRAHGGTDRRSPHSDLHKTTPTMKPCALIFQFVIKHLWEHKLKLFMPRPWQFLLLGL